MTVSRCYTFQSSILTTANVTLSQPLIAVVGYRLPTADFPIPQGSRNLASLFYQNLTSHSCNYALIQSKKKCNFMLLHKDCGPVSLGVKPIIWDQNFCYCQIIAVMLK
jgi:hypothetical protein